VAARSEVVLTDTDVRNERALARWRRFGFVFDDRVQTQQKTAQLAFLPADADVGAAA
jgi:hypothetical protein